MKSSKNLILILASLSFVSIMGAGIYEAISTTPSWSAAPPQSLTMFQGKYGLNSGLFWAIIHPVTMLLLVAALITNWKNSRRKQILFVFSSYIIILITTLAYFVPELIHIITSPYQDHVDKELHSRAALWEKLSFIRLCLVVLLSVVLLSALTKSTDDLNRQVK
jgi:hypothetical protein